MGYNLSDDDVGNYPSNGFAGNCQKYSFYRSLSEMLVLRVVIRNAGFTRKSQKYRFYASISEILVFRVIINNTDFICNYQLDGWAEGGKGCGRVCEGASWSCT